MEITAIEVSVGAFVIALLLAIASPVSIREGKRAAVAATACAGILRYAYNALLCPARCRVNGVGMGRIDLKPPPLLRAFFGAADIIGLAGTESEEITYLLLHTFCSEVVGISHDEGFPFPIKPQIAVFAFAIEVIIKI